MRDGTMGRLLEAVEEAHEEVTHLVRRLRYQPGDAPNRRLWEALEGALDAECRAIHEATEAARLREWPR